jgi:hypothetical protein
VIYYIVVKVRVDENKNKFIIWIISILIMVIFLGSFVWVAQKYYTSNIYVDFDVEERYEFSLKDEIVEIPVKIRNRMINEIGSTQKYFLTYHILSENLEVLKFDNIRSEIPQISPGLSSEVRMAIELPKSKGVYEIEVDIVKEGDYWLSEKGNEKKKIRVKIVD